MIPDVITLTLVNLTSMYNHAKSHMRGPTLKNWKDRILVPEVEKLEAQVPGYEVLWSIDASRFGLFVK